MKPTLCSSNDCVMCMACANICHKDAICIKIDEYGYEKIAIDEKKCVNCGLCTSVCQRRAEISRNVPFANYAAQALDYNELGKSASGGAFQMFAQSVLAQGGVCYGCTFTKEDGCFVAKHIRIDSLKDLSQILNTKYIPSIIGKSFQEALADLEAGKLVMFSGTPCQIQGLKAFLEKDYANLITVDLICHGIASTKLFNDYIHETETKGKIKISDYSFRDKSVSWGTNFCYSYYKEDAQKREHLKHCPREESSYTVYYLQADILRENCYSCNFSNTNRVSDFTLGDYWEIESEHPEFVTRFKPRIVLRRGVSCIMVNTSKAEQFLSNIQGKMIMHPVTLESITAHNGNLREPSQRGNRREQILKMYREKGYAPIELQYRESVKKKRILYRVKNILKSRLPDRVRIFIYQSPILRRIIFH